MDRRGLILIAFSALCLAASGMAYQQQKLGAMGAGLSRTISSAGSSCQGPGIDTGFGRLTCIQRTSGLFSGRSGGALNSGKSSWFSF